MNPDSDTAGQEKLSYVSATLLGLVHKMDGAEREVAHEVFLHYCGEFERIAPSTAQDALDVAYTVHALVDERVAHTVATSEHGPHVACREGCASCCHLFVDVTPVEAALAVRVAQAVGVTLDARRLALQAARTDATWRELAREDRACVFLGPDQRCQIYEHRPAACRKHMVRTEPDLCDTDKYPGGDVAIVVSIDAELVHSAAMTVYGAGGMATQLLLAMDRAIEATP